MATERDQHTDPTRDPQKTVDLPPHGPRNPDPITGAPGSHPIETGIGAAIGGTATGLAVGTLTAGPVGAAGGGRGGGWGGRRGPGSPARPTPPTPPSRPAPADAGRKSGRDQASVGA